MERNLSERLESIGCQTCPREGRSNGLPKDEPHAPRRRTAGLCALRGSPPRRAGRQVPYRLSSHFWRGATIVSDKSTKLCVK